MIEFSRGLSRSRLIDYLIFPRCLSLCQKLGIFILKQMRTYVPNTYGLNTIRLFFEYFLAN